MTVILKKGVIKIILKYIIPFVLLITLTFIISMNSNQINLSSDFNPNSIGSNINEYLKKTEEHLLDIKEGVAKKIIWANEINKKTPISIVYIHGFTASSEEVRPLPDKIASDLRANLFFTRLTGHGRNPSAMELCSIPNWMRDLHEAIEIGSG